MYNNSEELELGELIKDEESVAKITWKIPDVLTLPEYVDYKVQSPPFAFAEATWKLEMYPNGRFDENTEGFIDFQIVRLNSRTLKHNLFYKLCFITRRGKEFNSFSTAQFFESNNNEVGGIVYFLAKLKFLQMKNALAPKGVLTVVCEMRSKNTAVINRGSQIASTTTSSDSDFAQAAKHPVPLLDKVLSDYRDYFLEQKDCDVLITVKGVEFNAHRAILSARSPVLASTFRNDMKERATGTIDIEDCDPSSFLDFLFFLYCGDIQNLSLENVFSLFITADKYDVSDLRKMCLEYIKKNLSVDSFCDTISLALQYSETELVKLATNFFTKHAQKIIVTVKWQSFILKNPIQGNELFIKVLVPDLNKPL